MEPIWLLLPAILALGFTTSYTDIRGGKIRNRHLLLALAYVPVAYGIIITYDYLAGIPTNFYYLQDLGVNVLIALAFSFAAWNYKVWSAADGKLFVAYSGLAPLTAYSNTYFQYFPSFVLLINTFFPVFVFFTAKAFIISIKERKLNLRVGKKKAWLLELVLSSFWSGWIRNFIFLLVRLDIGYLGNLLFIYLIMRYMRRILDWKVAIPISSLILIFDYPRILTASFVTNFSLVLLSGVSLFFIISFSSGLFARRVSIGNIRPGMMLADTIIRNGAGRYEIAEPSGKPHSPSKKMLTLSNDGDGITADDVKKIKNMERRGLLKFHELKILDTVPFSPFLFFGAILTLLANGNFLIMIWHFIAT